MLDRKVSMNTENTINAVKWLFDFTGNVRLVSRITGLHPNTIKDITKDIKTTILGKRLYENEIESLRMLSLIKQGTTAKELCVTYDSNIKDLNQRTSVIKVVLEELIELTPSINDKVLNKEERDSESHQMLSLFVDNAYTMTQIADMYNVSVSTISRRINKYRKELDNE